MPTPRQTFRRGQRILASRDFQRVFRNSRRSRDALFMVCAHYTQNQAPRLGLAISKKHARHAVQRNRIKRISREVFRCQAATIASADYVIVNQPAASAAARSELAASLRHHFQALTTKKART